MITATLTLVFDQAHVRLDDDNDHIATWQVSRDFGPGPVPAATAVLAHHGFTVDEWEQCSGGISGGEWVATAQKAE